MSEVVEQRYAYAGSSRCVGDGGGLRLELATAGRATADEDTGGQATGDEATAGPTTADEAVARKATTPRLFAGTVAPPRQTATALEFLARVAASRFYTPASTLVARSAADPVVTSHGDRLRFEAFSACASVYARLDLDPEALQGRFAGPGTTNVDFNADFCAALSQVGGDDTLTLGVGPEDVELQTGGDTVVERRVPLPQRWYRGFAEVPLAAGELPARHDVGGVAARRFLRSLPTRPTGRTPFWVVAARSGLRVARRPSTDGVAVAGLERLRLLAPVARDAVALRVYGHPEGHAAGFELVLDRAAVQVVISGESGRGFSGEGAGLWALTDPAGEQAEPRLARALAWDAEVDEAALARATALDPAEVAAGLRRLAARGALGYDLARATWFHRELPYQAEALRRPPPRLRDAAALVADGAVEALGGGQGWRVRSGDVSHRVHGTGAGAACSCPWHARHQGRRGPCKHVLAARLAAATPAARAPQRR